MKRLFLLACIVAILAVRGYSQSASGGQTGAPNTSASVTIPAGTRILMTLTSPLHTASAQPGSGVYLEITEPVVYEDRVVIPPHSRVLGVVQQERRPGRIKGRAQLRLQFNRLILPDNHTLAIMGALQSLPGSSRDRTKDAEGRYVSGPSPSVTWRDLGPAQARLLGSRPRTASVGEEEGISPARAVL